MISGNGLAPAQCRPSKAVLETTHDLASYRTKRERGMKINLQLRKGNVLLYEGVHDVTDADSFGRAFAQVWTSVHDDRLCQTTSIGQLMELVPDETIAEINGAELILTKL
jgi:hypothetical protein